jgi:addiction module HigA family antidote
VLLAPRASRWLKACTELNGSARVRAKMDLRLSKALGTISGFWCGMQAAYDMWQAAHSS